MDSNTNNETNKWKDIAGKIFTVQSLSFISGIIIGIVSICIGWTQCHDSRNNTETTKQEKQEEDKSKFHEGLILKLGGFELENGHEYNVAVLGAINKKDPSYLFKFEIHNQDKLDAQNVLIKFDSDKPVNIMKIGQMTDSKIYVERGGEMRFANFYPQESTELAILFDSYGMKNGATNHCSFTCTCTHKAVPLSVKLNLHLYDFSSPEEFIKYISFHPENKASFFAPREDKTNFIILVKREYKQETLTYRTDTYKAVCLNGKIQLQGLVYKNN